MKIFLVLSFLCAYSFSAIARIDTQLNCSSKSMEFGIQFQEVDNQATKEWGDLEPCSYFVNYISFNKKNMSSPSVVGDDSQGKCNPGLTIILKSETAKKDITVSFAESNRSGTFKIRDSKNAIKIEPFKCEE